MKKNDVYFEAMKTRDPRFDGKFFIGVSTTGIYCRPICPAKPKRENVEFFRSALEAEKAGYRPCLRCRPEAAPLSPAWVGSSSVVQRAIRIIHTQQTLTFNEDEFAHKFGVSSRHLRRLFVEEIGKTPKQIAFENRLNLARKLITETQLKISDIAFASGFQSIRRFNDAFKDRFKKSPLEIRRKKSASANQLTISIPYRPPFDYQGLLNSYRSHRIADLEWFEDNKMNRLVCFNGTIGHITIANNPKQCALEVEIHFPEVSAIYSIISQVRAMFDLDSDPLPIENLFSKNKQLRNLLKKYPGIRLPSGWDPFEISISTILGQLVSIEQARKLVHSLVENIGQPSGYIINGKNIHLFPTADDIIAADLSFLKTTQKRKATLIAFCQALKNKELSLEPSQDIETFLEQALKIKGIGAWTAKYIALKALRDTNSFPDTDLVLARATSSLGKKNIDMMQPWRGYLAALLWREYSDQKIQEL